ncbi:MAG: helix-turn-helix transcriptional regulator [Bacteroidales bacterium]|nr:helix-turn-helix transcriptional regulator [Bacteroidales bacterium]
MADKRYVDMNLLYRYEPETPEDLCRLLAINLRKRRLERGLSREALSMMSGVPTPTIAKFETKYKISLMAFVAIAQALGYSHQIKELLSHPIYNTMKELQIINSNKNRKRGRNEFIE